MRLAKEEDLMSILSLLENNIDKAIYLYMDLKKYGLMNENIKVWVGENNQLIETIVMKYYDSFQIYSSDGERYIHEIVEYIKNEKVTMISGDIKIMNLICLNDEICNKYSKKTGYVYLFNKYREYEKSQEYEIAIGKEKDMAEVAELLYRDEGFSANYQKSVLQRQLQDRIQSKMGRSVIIRKNNNIIAHIATFAEAAGIAVTSGLIVDSEWRNYPYGTILESYLVNSLQKEGLTVYTFIIDKKRRKLLQALGHRECGEYMKLVLND